MVGMILMQANLLYGQSIGINFGEAGGGGLLTLIYTVFFKLFKLI